MIGDVLKKAARLAWFLPGFLLWAAFPPMCESTDCLFALAPLLWLARQGDPGTSAKRWFQSGVFFWVATLSWMPAIVKNGGPWPLVVLGWLALGAYCAAYFAAYGYLSAAYWRWANPTIQQSNNPTFLLRLLGILLVEPILWCGLELVRSRFLGGFAWNQLGVVSANNGFGAPAALGGVYLLSAVVILINGTVAGIAERFIAGIKARRGRPFDAAALSRWRTVETLLAFGVIWGVYALAAAVRPVETEPSSEKTIKVALVQRNFPCVFQTREENPYEVYGRLLNNVADLRPDLVVLPESAMCEFGPVDQQGAVRFAVWVREKTGGALLAGGTRYEEGETFNSAALYQVGKDSSAVQPSTFNLQPALSVYDKVHLVPFGEFIPGDRLFPALQKLAPVGSCTPGEPKLLSLSPSTSNLNLGVAICFEDTDSALVRRFAAMGAEALVFMTNDSWFSHSNEALAHAWQATARAIETGLPVLRVGNSGVTGTIRPDGSATWLIGTNGRVLVDRSGTMCDRVQLASRPTPYVRLGDIPLAVLFALLITGMILVKYANYKRRKDLI